MTPMNQQIEQRIQSFVSEITAIARRAALDALQSGLGGSEARPARVARDAAPAPQRAAGRKRGRKPARAAAGSRTVGGRRDPEAVERVKAAVLAHIAENPGHGAEQIGSALGRSTAEIALPIKKLLEEKEIKRKGQRRGTRYFRA